MAEWKISTCTPVRTRRMPVMSDSSVRPCPIVFDWCYVSASYCAESVLIFHPRAQSQIRGGAFRAHSPPQAKNERNGTSMPCGGRRNRAVPPLEIVGNKSTNTTEKLFTHNNRIMAYQVPEIVKSAATSIEDLLEGGHTLGSYLLLTTRKWLLLMTV